MARLYGSLKEELIVEEDWLGSVGCIALVVHVCTYRYILPLCGRHLVTKIQEKKVSDLEYLVPSEYYHARWRHGYGDGKTC